MARNTEGPWFRKAKDTWYATVSGKSVSLGVKGTENRSAAVTAWHRLMAGVTEQPQLHPAVSTPTIAGGITVSELTKSFLEDVAERVTPNTLALYKHFLTGFADRYGKQTVESLTPHDAESYSRKPQWSASTRNDFITCLVSAVKWAMRVRQVTTNPLIGVRKPPKTSRGAKAVIEEAEYRRLLDAAGPEFSVYLQGLWLTGCRPGELARLRVEDVDYRAGVAILNEHKTAHQTGKPRVVFFSPAALALCRRQAAKRHPSGLLFPNRRGGIFTRPITIKLMESAREKARVPHATCYGFRHSYATHALSAGVPDAQVAALLGHSGTAMLHKHYSHLTSRTDVLRAAAARVR